MHLVFVDCEARGRSPVNGVLTEFGAVHYETGATFHGTLFASAILALLTYSFVLANVDAAFATGLVGALLIGVFRFQNAIAALRAARVRGAALRAAAAQP